MNNPLDDFGIAVKAARQKRNASQKTLAAKLNMSVRTILEIENFRSNPKFETVALLARELDINLNSIVFPDAVSADSVSKSVVDFFADKSEVDAQKYIDLCEQADKFSGKERE